MFSCGSFHATFVLHVKQMYNTYLMKTPALKKITLRLQRCVYRQIHTKILYNINE